MGYIWVEMMEMKGIYYISTPRPGGRRGGGVAMAFPKTRFQVSKLNIEIPKPLECIFALVKPNESIGKARKVIAVCFYSPPRSRSNSKLIDLITTEVARLRTVHPGAGVLICGDKNDLKLDQLLAGDPSLRQAVTLPTNKNQDKVLDVVITDLHAGYQEPTILPAIPVDPDREGVPSDHLGVEVRPRTTTSTTRVRPRKKTFEVQRMPESLVAEFGPVLPGQDWGCLEDGASPGRMVEQFEEYAGWLVDQKFPKKLVTVTDGDLPYMTDDLKKLRRRRDKVYDRRGKCDFYWTLQQQFETKLRAECRKYREKIVNEVTLGKRGSSYKAIRKLGEGKEDWDKRKEFVIPEYVEQALTPGQAANRLAAHFSSISQTVAPLDTNNFHLALRLEVQEGKSSSNKPCLSQHDVYMKIKQTNKPESSVKGDIPKKLMTEYSYLWAGPVTRIFNNIIQTATWPEQWKSENAICLHKTEDPRLVKSEDDVRTISKTNFLSKVFEKVLGSWLLPLVEPYLDPGQCGGLSGTSTSHYLVKLVDFIHSTLDRREPHAAVLATMDLSKAFNRGDSMVIEDLYDMHVPGWLLAILCSYLTSRSMVLTYQGATSTPHSLPGGYGAGTWLGGFLFTIKFNGICLRPPIPRPCGNRAIQLKYVDDSTKTASINMKHSLQDDPTVRLRPLNFHERTEKCLKPDENILQQELDRFHDETTRNNFVTNQSKSFVMVYNRSRNFAFAPEFTSGPSGTLEVRKTLKILGILIQEDLKWGAQTDKMINKASKKIWLLRRMKKIGVDEITMTSYWRSEGLCHLETASPVWSGGLSKAQEADLSPPSPGAPPAGQTPVTRTSSPGGRATPGC